MIAPALPGWHGKLPALGDFASRRMPPEFLDHWDPWLAAGMLRLREADPTGWRDAYLCSPVQRFLLLPGALPGRAGQQAWGGVLMPSVDRVGRYFPFTIVQALGTSPLSQPAMCQLWSWLGRLDGLAVDALQDDWAIDRLEAELVRLGVPTTVGAAAVGLAVPQRAGATVTMLLPPDLEVARLIGDDAIARWQAEASGLAFWSAHPESAAPSLRVSRGLPTSAAVLLGRPGAT